MKYIYIYICKDTENPYISAVYKGFHDFTSGTHLLKSRSPSPPPDHPRLYRGGPHNLPPVQLHAVLSVTLCQLQQVTTVSAECTVLKAGLRHGL